MNGELKDQVANGVAWSMAEKAGTTLFQMGVSIVILRLLMPADFGVVAVLTAFAAIALIVVDSGFSQTLIRKATPTPEDYKSVFLFNLTASLLSYGLLVGLSPLVARYYGMPIITQIAPVFFLMIPVNALCVIQNTLYTRQFRFALLSKVTFTSSLVSGLIAIGMALAGCGVWSLVVQRVATMAVRAALLWGLSSWRPSARGSLRPLREMAPFSLSLMTTDLIATLYTKIPQLFIGRLYPAAILGFYDQAQKLKDLPVTSAMQSVQVVTFPALSKIGDDLPKFTESYRQVVMIVAYVMFPLMVGLTAVAEDVFGLLLGQKWIATVPYFEVICLTGLFAPVSMIAYNVLKVKSKGRTIVRLEILKKVIMTLILALTIPQSVLAVVWGLVAMSAVEMVVNFAASTRFTTLTPRRFLRTLLPIVLTTTAMYVAVQLADYIVCGTALSLLLKILAGVVSYAGLSFLFRLEAFHEVVGMIKKQATHC